MCTRKISHTIRRDLCTLRDGWNRDQVSGASPLWAYTITTSNCVRPLGSFLSEPFWYDSAADSRDERPKFGLGWQVPGLRTFSETGAKARRRRVPQIRA